MKIRPVGAELFHSDLRTDRHDEAHIRFSNFCECVYKCLGETSLNSVLACTEGFLDTELSTAERTVSSIAMQQCSYQPVCRLSRFRVELAAVVPAFLSVVEKRSYSSWPWVCGLSACPGSVVGSPRPKGIAQQHT
jgi:hypothetical protein